jgi:hypothetical protein
MPMKVRPELEPMQRLREAVPTAFHGVLSLRTGTVTSPADPGGILVAFGAALIVVGCVYRTPFPVQPMKAIAPRQFPSPETSPHSRRRRWSARGLSPD